MIAHDLTNIGCDDLLEIKEELKNG